YPVLIIKTSRLLYKTRPGIVFVQNPSVVLTMLVLLISRILRYQVIIDAHNAGLFPLEGSKGWLNKIAMRINKSASVVIVTNDELKQYVEDNGGKACSIPDPIPEIACTKKSELHEGSFDVVCVSSWADDEPYREVIAAAGLLGDSVRIYMTGNSKGRHVVEGRAMPQNVVLTGFISNEEYEDLICTCDAVMVLTSRENCLVCGAYEGVAVEKPLILSSTKALKKYFCLGAVYAENTADSIAESIRKVRDGHEQLLIDIRNFKENAIKAAENIIAEFKTMFERDR
ncbi:MAG: hypothetical protein OEZ15_03405, partial [Gammaproteobacteria bacterium]|nr:hypothetical protein [Gammaproteobacteria bacterium]